jgi:predicted Zn-dependent protease with MMP-like domain
MTTSESGGYDLLTETEWDQVQRVWEQIEDGELEAARQHLDPLLAKRPGHPDLRIVNAAVLLEEGDAERALETLNGAERSADPAVFFHLRALSAFDLARFEAARDDAERAISVRPGMAEAHDLLSRIHDHLGNAERAREHAAEAQTIDPEEFPPPLEIGDEEFDRLVEASIADLPNEVKKHLEELPVIVEPLPRRELLTAEHPPLTPDLLGLFVGRHLLGRSHSDVPGSPGAIYLFRRNLLRSSADRDELAKEIRTTVQHEVGHLLGLDEDDLEEWGLA